MNSAYISDKQFSKVNGQQETFMEAKLNEMYLIAR